MEEILLEVEPRQETGRLKVNSLRGMGFTPAVIYGEAKEPLSIKISTSVLIKLIHQHRVEGAIIKLKVKEDKKQSTRACLIKEIQYDPIHGNIIHMDFNEISLTKEIKVRVPVLVKGEAVGVKQEGGSLEHILWEIEIECLPADIPKGIEIDISHLKLGESVHIKELVLPSSVKALNDPGAIVLTIAAPMKEEVPAEALEGEEKKEPEVIKEKKEVPVEGEAGAKEKGKEK
ncbi:MAG: 50S ribosomal protein L25 [Candidatus Omnitrophota bacterium]|nr:50S ribosomal protein L25 [Candidatus Omnitrophota bacterium]